MKMNSALEALAKFCAVLAGLVMVGITLLTCASVVGRNLFQQAINGDFVGARDRLRELILKYGLAGTDIIKQVHIEIFRFNIPERWKPKLADTIGEIDYRLTQEIGRAHV